MTHKFIYDLLILFSEKMMLLIQASSVAVSYGARVFTLTNNAKIVKAQFAVCDYIRCV